MYSTTHWFDSIWQGLRLVTQRSRVQVPPGHSQVIYTDGAQANSVFHPSGVGK